MMPQSPSKWAPWDFTQFSQSPSAAQLYFPASHRWSEISSFSKVILVLGKARSHRVPNLGCCGGWVTWVTWCFTKKPCTRRDAWAGALSWWSCQSPVAHSCVLLNHPKTFPQGNVQAWCKIWCRFVALLTQSLWMRCPHSAHAHSAASTTPTGEYSEVIIVHTCAFQSTLLGCQVTSMSHKPFLLCK